MNDIEKLNSVKFNIRKALESQGSDITADTPFEEYPSYIMGLSGGGGSGSGGGSGLPSSIYYIMTLVRTGDYSAEIDFRRPQDDYISMSTVVSVNKDTETEDLTLEKFGKMFVNPEPDTPIPEEDIAAMQLKIASWSRTSYGAEAWLQLITGEVTADFYVYPYIL